MRGASRIPVKYDARPSPIARHERKTTTMNSVPTVADVCRSGRYLRETGESAVLKGGSQLKAQVIWQDARVIVAALLFVEHQPVTRTDEAAALRRDPPL